MGKASRRKQQPKREITVRETHEPPEYLFSPDDITFETTGDDTEECFVLTVHGVRHYVHAARMPEFIRRLNSVTERWETESLAQVEESERIGAIPKAMADFARTNIANIRRDRIRAIENG